MQQQISFCGFDYQSILVYECNENVCPECNCSSLTNGLKTRCNVLSIAVTELAYDDYPSCIPHHSWLSGHPTQRSNSYQNKGTRDSISDQTI